MSYSVLSQQSSYTKYKNNKNETGISETYTVTDIYTYTYI